MLNNSFHEHSKVFFEIKMVTKNQSPIKIIRIWQMPFEKKNRFLLNFFLCGLARAAIHLLPYKRLSPFFGNRAHRTIASTIISKENSMQAVLIGNSIRLAAKYTPWNSSCLTQAMVAAFWCRRYHIPYLLFIGFAKSSPKPLVANAHAWVTAGPIAITGGHSDKTHEVVLSYSTLIF
jgi:hypothetical protein